MEWQMVVALVVAVPVILFSAAFVWYLYVSGIVHVLSEVRTTKKKKAALLKIQPVEQSS